jgi:hypothetical protein
MQSRAMRKLNDPDPADSLPFLLFACAIHAGGQMIGLAGNNAGEANALSGDPADSPAPATSISPALQPDEAGERIQQQLRLGRFGRLY